jgi:hypothetical protein
MARPSKFTNELGERICYLVRQGVPLRHALGSEGISKTTLHGWRQKAKDGEQPFVLFAEKLEASMGGMVVDYVQPIHAAALGGDWKAASWMLERRAPEFRRSSEKPAAVAGDTTQIAMPSNGRMRDGS